MSHMKLVLQLQESVFIGRHFKIRASGKTPVAWQPRCEWKECSEVQIVVGKLNFIVRLNFINANLI